MNPYRGDELVELLCPRCKDKKLPPLDVATCACGGVWVSAFAASEVLTEVDRRANPGRWWRVREPCPACGEQMALHGDGAGLLQACTVHGYFIDADVIPHTGLGRGIDHAALDRKRQDTARVEAERDEREREANRRAAARAAREEQERALAEESARRRETVELVTNDELLIAALRHALGDAAAAALLERLRYLENRVRVLEARV